MPANAAQTSKPAESQPLGRIQTVEFKRQDAKAQRRKGVERVASRLGYFNNTGFQPGVGREAVIEAASAALTGCGKPLKRLLSSAPFSTGLKPVVNGSRNKEKFARAGCTRGAHGVTRPTAMGAWQALSISLPTLGFRFKRLVLALWVYGCAAGLAGASPVQATGKPPLPEDLRFDFQPVPAEQNAIILWRRAAELKVALNEQEKAALKFCYTPEARKPADDEMAGLQSWLQRNREALDLFNASLAKPKAQWPELDPEKPRPEMVAFSILMQARLLVASQLAGQNQFEAAAKSLEDSLKLAQMGIGGNPNMIQYLVACRARTLAQDAILRLAAGKAAPVPILERLLKDLPDLESETNTYANVLRVEFTWQYNRLVDIKQEAAQWTKAIATNSVLLMLYPEDCQRPLRVLMDPSLVSFHPLPFDRNADLEETMRYYRIFRTNTCSAWLDRSEDVNTESEENHSNLLQDIAPLMKLVEKEPLPLSRAAAQRARAAYLELKNPVGRIWDCSSAYFAFSDIKVFKTRTERAATRAVLALLIFEHRKGILPAKLSDLVDEKILPAVPTDPFSGEPLLYSRERRLVWSVGLDATDDDGKAGKSRWSGADAVWPIPTLN